MCTSIKTEFPFLFRELLSDQAETGAAYGQTDRVGLKFVETAEVAKTLFASGRGTSLAPQPNDIFRAVTDAGAAFQLSTGRSPASLLPWAR
ncbi:hypothetical protein [uncultured Desulfovibrio sp.]|uniref:hypothetical protein n=1 Tax=uncultured Desulfovibrio sp. TaxID=167968 RepID=UPI0003A4EDAA|nr:hypothetical protein [uncultured Desulfovibrio sp.]